LGDGDVVRADPEASHDAQLTREDMTASVHYIRFQLSSQQIEAFARGSVRLAVNHPAYQHEVELGEETRTELLADLTGEASRAVG
jgi:hypothetical protein